MARIPRIFHPEPLQAGSEISLPPGPAQHVAKVLRLGEGAQLIMFDGLGGHYTGSITACDKRSVQVRLGSHCESTTESPLRITLAQGVSRGERMDLTIQKAVELGVSRIVPLDTERSVVRLKGDRLEKKQQHWQGVIQSACEQCGRDVIPELLPSQRLENWLQQEVRGSALLLDPCAAQGIGGLPDSNEVTLLIGPEGGLSRMEIHAAHDAGFHGVRLGPRVLRTETAALAAIAVLQSHWGDIG